jgi:hypothetical protein
MSIKIYVTEEEVMSTPNDFELGEIVRKKYWIEKEHQELRDYDNQKFITVVDEETGLVTGVHFDNSNTYTQDGYDKCVICGKVSPYKTNTNIDLRIGYIEGGGQGCFQSSICNK